MPPTLRTWHLDHRSANQLSPANEEHEVSPYSPNCMSHTLGDASRDYDERPSRRRGNIQIGEKNDFNRAKHRSKQVKKCRDESRFPPNFMAHRLHYVNQTKNDQLSQQHAVRVSGRGYVEVLEHQSKPISGNDDSDEFSEINEDDRSEWVK